MIIEGDAIADAETLTLAVALLLADALDDSERTRQLITRTYPLLSLEPRALPGTTNTPPDVFT